MLKSALLCTTLLTVVLACTQPTKSGASSDTKKAEDASEDVTTDETSVIEDRGSEASEDATTEPSYSYCNPSGKPLLRPFPQTTVSALAKAIQASAALRDDGTLSDTFANGKIIFRNEYRLTSKNLQEETTGLYFNEGLTLDPTLTQEQVDAYNLKALNHKNEPDINIEALIAQSSCKMTAEDIEKRFPLVERIQHRVGGGAPAIIKDLYNPSEWNQYFSCLGTFEAKASVPYPYKEEEQSILKKIPTVLVKHECI